MLARARWDRRAKWSPLRHATLFTCLWVLVLLRNPVDTWWPSLINEDGAILLKHYYENPGLEHLWLWYAGYVSAMPDVLAFLGASLPPRWVAHAYLLMATAWFAIAYSVLYFPRFRRLIARDVHRVLLCVVLTLLPLGNVALMRAVMFSFWPLLLVSTLICIVPGSRRPGVVGAECALLAINACSSPVSAILLPALAWRAWRGRSRLETALFVAVALVSVAYLLVAVDTRGAQGSLGHAVLHSIPAFGDRVGFGPFLSDWLRMQLIGRGLHAVPVVVGWVILLAILGWLASHPTRRAVFLRERAVTGWMLYCMAALTALALYARFGPDGLDYASAFHQRYFWIQQCLLCLTIAIGAVWDPWLARVLSRRKPRRLVVALAAVYLVMLNLLDGYKSFVVGQDGRAVAELLARIEACEAAGGCCEPVELERGGDPAHSFEIVRFRSRAARPSTPESSCARAHAS